LKAGVNTSVWLVRLLGSKSIFFFLTFFKLSEMDYRFCGSIARIKSIIFMTCSSTLALCDLL
jgi:hypothetical protein